MSTTHRLTLFEAEAYNCPVVRTAYASYLWMALHHRVADSTQNNGAMPHYPCIMQIIYAHAIQVHCTNHTLTLL